METKGQLLLFGLGSQAKAWALNLRDSGWEITVALRNNSPSEKVAQQLGLPVIAIAGPELSQFKNFLMLTPDESHGQILRQLAPSILAGSRIIYAHGYSFVKESLSSEFPQYGHLLLAPKAIASEVRFQYETVGKLGAAFSLEAAIETDSDEKFLRALAKDLGITGLYPCTFQQECYADLFSEQSLLCGLLPYGALHSYNLLIKRGIPKEIAYMECWLEVKLIADAMIPLGPEKFFKMISPNALIGGEKAQGIIFDKGYQTHLERLAEEIWSGDFFGQVSATDFEALQAKVQEFWRGQDLTRTHRELAPELYPQKQ